MIGRQKTPTIYLGRVGSEREPGPDVVLPEVSVGVNTPMDSERRSTATLTTSQNALPSLVPKTSLKDSGDKTNLREQEGQGVV